MAGPEAREVDLLVEFEVFGGRLDGFDPDCAEAVLEVTSCLACLAAAPECQADLLGAPVDFVQLAGPSIVVLVLVVPVHRVEVQNSVEPSVVPALDSLVLEPDFEPSSVVAHSRANSSAASDFAAVVAEGHAFVVVSCLVQDRAACPLAYSPVLGPFVAAAL